MARPPVDGIHRNVLIQNYYREVALVSLPIDPDYARHSTFIGDRAWLNNVPPIDQLIWALSGPLCADDINPPPITQATFNPATWETRAFTGTTYAQASRAFNEYAMEHGFGDGLPLIVPTQALVDEMLTGTTRDRDEVIGKLKMRGGVITIEKIAINAVMAGARPEHLPVIIAAMEAYGAGWEFDKMWYHPMTSGGNFGLAVIVSGPLAAELGMNSGTGWAGSGNEANNTIGRAIRMSIRNIGHNSTPYVDTANRTGRFFDHTLLTFAENDANLPTGWRTHSEMMGFSADQSTVTLLGFVTPWTLRGNESGSAHPMQELIATRPGVGGAANFVLFSPAIAGVMAYYLGFECKNDVKEWYATHDASGNPTPRNIGIFANTHILVVGSDPGQTVNLSSIFLYGQNLCNTTQLISGATLTTHGRGATTPSTPQNFEVEVGVSGQATLRWDAPLSDGGSPITGYQVSWLHGGNRQTSPWTEVLGGADAREFTITGLVDGGQYFFKVRATNGVVNTSEIVGNQVTMNRIGGRGAWARVNDVRPYDATPPANYVLFDANGGEFTFPANAWQINWGAGSLNVENTVYRHYNLNRWTNGVFTMALYGGDFVANPGYTFVGWATSPDAADLITYADGNPNAANPHRPVVPGETFYAIWEVATVTAPVPSFDIFNNGAGGSPSRPNAGLAAAGTIRMWAQLDGVNTRIPFAAAATITAFDQDDECAMSFVTVSRMWEPGGFIEYFNQVNVNRNGDWDIINFSITIYGQTVNLVLVND